MAELNLMEGLAQITGQRHPVSGKPMIQNPGGSVSTERTITIEMDGFHYVIPTIINGQVYKPEIAIDMFRKGTNKPVGVFGTADEANAFAAQRSNELGRTLPR